MTPLEEAYNYGVKLAMEEIYAFPKVAAEMGELYHAASKIPHVRVPKRISSDILSGLGKGPAMMPSPRIMRESVLQGNRIINPSLTKSTPEMADLLSHVRTPVRSNTVTSVAGGASGYLKQAPRAARKLMTNITDMTPAQAHAMVPDVKGLPTTPTGHRSLNTLTRIHEGFEAGVPKHRVTPITSHLSPDVMMKEHNLALKATGHGSEELRASRDTLRGSIGSGGGGEDEMMHNAVKRLYGERGADLVKREGYSKAMRKNLTEHVRKNPSLLHEAG